MSIQKFNDESELQQDLVPFTQINTKILQSIKNLEAGFVWAYLLSFPPKWKVIKKQLKNHFAIGDLKIKKIFSYLNKHNLIEYIPVRDDFGKRIIRWDIRILNGSKFIYHENDSEKNDNKQNVSKKSYAQPTGSEINPVDNQPGRESRSINKTHSIKENKNIKNREGNTQRFPLSAVDNFDFKSDIKSLLVKNGLDENLIKRAFKNYYEDSERKTFKVSDLENWAIREINYCAKINKLNKKETKSTVKERVRDDNFKKGSKSVAETQIKAIKGDLKKKMVCD